MKFKFKSKHLIDKIEREIKSKMGSKELSQIKGSFRKLSTLIPHHPQIRKLSPALQRKISTATDSVIGIYTDPAYPQNRQLVCGIKLDFSGRKKVFIGDSDHNDFVSVETSSKGDDIDYSTLRLFSHSIADLRDMGEAQLRKIATNLNGRMPKDAAGIWKLKNPKLQDVENISRFVNFIQDKRKSLTRSEIRNCRANGCTAVPDFNIKECCDKHDVCYCIGGTENDRLKCDVDFLACMNDKKFSLAGLYYEGVRTFGRFRFNYS